MSLIEGVGDEVTKFFIAVIVITIGILAWWSTGLAQRPLIRTVLILEHRTRTQTPQTVSQVVTARVRNRSAEPGGGGTGDERDCEGSSQEPGMGEPSVSTDEGAQANQSCDEQERDDIVKAMDSDSNIIRKRRLAFFQNRSETNTADNRTHEESAGGEDGVNNSEQKTEPENCQQQEQNVDKIRIKLKYLNDDLKLVQGSLREQLGDFKRRHFEVELAARKLVRLIFNGQVLQEDNETLEKYGLFDNCVVHCLVHQAPISASAAGDDVLNRNGENQSDNSQTTRRRQRMRDNGNLHWDLGNLFLALITLILVSAWYYRFEYAHLFTVTATVGLVCLTGIFTLLIVGLFFPANTPRVTPVATTTRDGSTIETVTATII